MDEQQLARRLPRLEGPDHRPGHAEKSARWQNELAPLIEPRLPASKQRVLEARAIAAAGITCVQTAIEEWVRLRGRADLAELYDTAVRAVRRR